MSFRSNPKEWDEIQRRGVTRQLTTGTEAQAEKNKLTGLETMQEMCLRPWEERAHSQALSQNTLPWVLRFRTTAQSAAQTGSCSSYRGRCEAQGWFTQSAADRETSTLSRVPFRLEVLLAHLCKDLYWNSISVCYICCLGCIYLKGRWKVKTKISFSWDVASSLPTSVHSTPVMENLEFNSKIQFFL